MLKAEKVQEECLYCHNNGIQIPGSCPKCGDEWLKPKRPDQSMRPTAMFQPVSGFEPQIAGV